METTQKVKPGLKGTKRLVEQYGDKLVCVRYRDDYKNQRKIKTIELIIDERPLSKNQSRIPAARKGFKPTCFSFHGIPCGTIELRIISSFIRKR